MALPFKPHTVSVRRASAVKRAGTNQVIGTAFGSAVNIRCHVVAENATRVLEERGIETSEPHRVYVDFVDVDAVTVGDEITYNGRVFKAITPIEQRLAGLELDHGEFLMDVP